MALDDGQKADLFGALDEWADARAKRLAEEAAEKEKENPDPPAEEKPKGLVQQILGM